MPPGSARRATDVAAADPSAGSRAEAWPEVVSQLRDFWARAAALVGGGWGSPPRPQCAGTRQAPGGVRAGVPSARAPAAGEGPRGRGVASPGPRRVGGSLGSPFSSLPQTSGPPAAVTGHAPRGHADRSPTSPSTTRQAHRAACGRCRAALRVPVLRDGRRRARGRSGARRRDGRWPQVPLFPRLCTGRAPACHARGSSMS